MRRVEEYRSVLRGLSVPERTRYLDDHSGLPGPRGNLELMQAAADEGDPAWFDDLLADDDEYRAATGAVGLGRELAAHHDEVVIRKLHRTAADPRWRVREGVAMALQRLGDSDPSRLWPLVRRWAADPDPLVARAAVAGVCEPRLLRDPNGAGVALETCATATRGILARPRAERRAPEVRVLRQALGYCWSVAVAAAPVQGLPRFRELEQIGDPGVSWIVRENSRKRRMKGLLESLGLPSAAGRRV